MQHTQGTIQTQDGIQLYTQEWAPESGVKAAICLVHGLGEHSGRYEHVARFFIRLIEFSNKTLDKTSPPWENLRLHSTILRRLHG